MYENLFILAAPRFSVYNLMSSNSRYLSSWLWRDFGADDGAGARRIGLLVIQFIVSSHHHRARQQQLNMLLICKLVQTTSSGAYSTDHPDEERVIPMLGNNIAATGDTDHCEVAMAHASSRQQPQTGYVQTYRTNTTDPRVLCLMTGCLFRLPCAR